MNKEKMLLEVARKTMFKIEDAEMAALVQEYDTFLHHVEALELIDTREVEPLSYPYEIETTFLREDNACDLISKDDALKNAKSTLDGQIKVPKVVE